MEKKKTAIYLGWADQPVSGKVLKILKKYMKLKLSRDFRSGDKFNQKKLAKLKVDFLFSFGPLIVRKELLDSIKIAAINFHTASPKWPGRGSCSFALLAGDKEFGVTAHLMTEEIDQGRILKVNRFPIAFRDSAESLHRKTLEAIPRLVEETLRELAKRHWKIRYANEKWARKALRYENLTHEMGIRMNDSDEIIEKKIRAFAYPGKPGPYLVRGKRKFWYLAEKQGNPPDFASRKRR